MKLERGLKLGRGRSACATVRAEFSRREWSFAREETDLLDEMLVLEPLAHAQALEGTIDGRARDGGDDDGDDGARGGGSVWRGGVLAWSACTIGGKERITPRGALRSHWTRAVRKQLSVGVWSENGKRRGAYCINKIGLLYCMYV